jgi:hypothetical protein
MFPKDAAKNCFFVLIFCMLPTNRTLKFRYKFTLTAFQLIQSSVFCRRLVSRAVLTWAPSVPQVVTVNGVSWPSLEVCTIANYKII